MDSGMNVTTAKLFYRYVKRRGFDHVGGYETWLERFKAGTEWMYSDYQGRGILRAMGVCYPVDLNAQHCFDNEWCNEPPINDELHVE